MEKFPEPIIALVDDDSDNHYIFQEALIHSGYTAQLILFNSGIKFLEYISDQSNIIPHLIFLDINMPVLDGKKCIEPIKSHLHPLNIPIIMLTASENPADIQETFQSGANRYFIKPSCFSTMVNILSNVLQSHFNHSLQPQKDRYVLLPVPGSDLVHKHY